MRFWSGPRQALCSPAVGLLGAPAGSSAHRLRNDPQRRHAVIAGEYPGIVWQPAYVGPWPRPLLVAHDAGLSVALRCGQTVRVECRTGTSHEAPPNLLGSASASFLSP